MLETINTSNYCWIDPGGKPSMANSEIECYKGIEEWRKGHQNCPMRHAYFIVAHLMPMPGEGVCGDSKMVDVRYGG